MSHLGGDGKILKHVGAPKQGNRHHASHMTIFVKVDTWPWNFVKHLQIDLQIDASEIQAKQLGVEFN